MAIFEYDDSLEEFLDAGVYVFDRDPGNRSKNWTRHRVTIPECEEVFFRGSLPIGAQVDSPANESRYDDVWSASHTGGPAFGPANSAWYGTPVWYRYVGP